MPRKTDSHQPSDWLHFAEADLAMIRASAEREISYPPCRGKLAEALEKIMKAELIRLGSTLVKIHDLRRLASELRHRGTDLGAELDSLSEALADSYFSARYPGFDLEDPDWPALRVQLEAITALAAAIRSRLTSPPA